MQQSPMQQKQGHDRLCVRDQLTFAKCWARSSVDHLATARRLFERLLGDHGGAEAALLLSSR